jgi:spindle assembly abnormal protein 6
MTVDLYTKPVHIVLKSNLSTTGDPQSTTSLITISISQSITSTRTKSLEIQLTDETDPFFLYQLEITEEEFHILKNEQTLLVDFAQFPFKVIELLELCNSSAGDPSPKY